MSSEMMKTSEELNAKEDSLASTEDSSNQVMDIENEDKG
jgi:hypothetical protein